MGGGSRSSAATRPNTPNNPRGVYVMNVDGSDLHRVIEDESAASPTWSPDGTTIVFAGVSCLPAGSFDSGICAVETDGSGLRALTAFRRCEQQPELVNHTPAIEMSA